jgi:type VI secretion system protein ImpK
MSSQPFGAPGAGAAAQFAQRRPENLAFVFQELLTVGERLRSNRQAVSDAPSFRAQIWEAVKTADQEARRRGYTSEDIELAVFAVIAFLDESILNMRLPVFADWPRQPLQEERYGHHIAGEIFFQNLQKLIGRADSQELADLIEVYYLCLLLGFAGRYSIGGRGDLRAIMQQTAEKLGRIRQLNSQLSPEWYLPQETVKVVSGDPVVKWMLIGAVTSVILTLVLFISFRIFLGNGVTALRTIAVQGRT